MRKLIVSACCVMALVGAQSAFAGEKGAGCGIGKVVMEGKSGVGANLVASILNDILIPRTFFMTTGVLGCDTTQTVQNDQQTESFVAMNMDSLAVDMAQGQGEHLAALASMIGINGEDEAAFYGVARDQYGSVFGAEELSSTQLLDSLHTAMLADPSLAKYVAQ